MLIVSVAGCLADGKRFAVSSLVGATQKKRPHFWGHSSKEAKGRKCQERRCKGPIRQADRLRVRSRERRVKVKRGLFSCFIEEHFPRQNFHFDVERTASMQVKANTLLTETFEIHPRGRQSRSRGQNHAHSCTLTAGHYSGPKDIKALFRQWVAFMSYPRPFAASPAGNDRAARARSGLVRNSSIA
jgi:hypothetical protein